MWVFGVIQSLLCLLNDGLCRHGQWRSINSLILRQKLANTRDVHVYTDVYTSLLILYIKLPPEKRDTIHDLSR